MEIRTFVALFVHGSGVAPNLVQAFLLVPNVVWNAKRFRHERVCCDEYAL
jgi:hypothetical protein